MSFKCRKTILLYELFILLVLNIEVLLNDGFFKIVFQL